MALPVVISETAHQILIRRGLGQLPGADVLVSVCGKVICVSEVVKIKDSPLFMVKFHPNVDIIIKRKELLSLHLNISPYKQYVLTDLRPTSLQKGSCSKQNVYTVTKNSKLLRPDDINLNVMTLTDWLSLHGLQENDAGSHDDEVCHDSVIEDLFSYKGRVTAVLDQVLGVFELDNRVRLYTGPVPAVHKFSMLTVGSEILIQNAHYTISQQNPRVSLYCCMLSSIRCKDPCPGKGLPVRLNQTLQRMLYLEGLSQSQLDQLFNYRSMIKEQFYYSLGERLTEKVFSTICELTTRYDESTDRAHVQKGPKRAFIDEFLNTPHSCPLMKACKASMKLQTIREVADGMCDVSNETMDWNLVRRMSKDNHVLLGILELSERTGQVILSDSTRNIPVVICSYGNSHDMNNCCHGNKEETEMFGHKCTGTCDCELVSGEKFSCPYLHCCCIGKIIAILRYEMISGTMVTRTILPMSSNAESSRSHCDKYLIFDMRNTVCVGDSSLNARVSSQCSSYNKEKLNSCQKEMHRRNFVSNETVEYKRKDTKQSHVNDINKALETNLPVYKQETKCDPGKENVVGEGEGSQKSTEICDDVNKTSYLHKHKRVDGSTVFCRKVECFNRNVACSTVVRTTDVTGEISRCATSNILDDFKENAANSLRYEAKTSSAQSNNFGCTVLKVKPVSSRKRPSDTQYTDKENREVKRSVQNEPETRKIARQEFNIGEDNKKEVDCDIKEILPSKDRSEKQSETVEESGLLNGKVGFRVSENVGKEPEGKIQEIVDGQVVDGSTKNCDILYECDGFKNVLVYIESKGSLLKEDRHLRFNMECTVIKTNGLEKTILQFSNKSVGWYPLFYPGAVYRLSAGTDNGPLFTSGIISDKIQKMLKKSNTKRCYFVKGDVQLLRIWNVPIQSLGVEAIGVIPLKDVLKTEFSQKFVNFEGLIVNRTLVKQGLGSTSLFKDIGACGMYSRLHVQDPSRTEDIWVYLNDSNIVNEKGLIPGSRVIFYELERKLSQLNNVYCRLVPMSSVQILCLEPDRAVSKPTVGDLDASKPLPVLYLGDIWGTARPGESCQCICDIEKILKVSLKSLCETCGSVVIATRCSNKACTGDSGYRFLARASAIIDDSTSVGMVTLTGSSVQSMLQLSHDQWKCLEEEVSNSGEIFIQQFNPNLTTPLERFVYRLCDNSAVKQTWLMILKTKSGLDINKIANDEFCTKNFDTGSARISTQCLPFLQLDCLSLKVFEPSMWSIHNLSAQLPSNNT